MGSGKTPAGLPRYLPRLTTNGGCVRPAANHRCYKEIVMDTIIKLAVLIAICGGGAVAIAVGMQMIARRSTREKQ